MKGECIVTYYIKDYYTGEIIDTATDFDVALDISNHHPDSEVTDENNSSYYYTNVELPF